MNLIKEKINQAIAVLNEMDIDLWLIFCRESEITPDPSLPLVGGQDVVGQSAFLISKTGRTIAILSTFDTADTIQSNVYNEVIAYNQDISEKLFACLNELNPNKIAINYSLNSSVADGLTHGMFLKLKEYLNKTPFSQRLICAEPLIFKVRGQKSKSELELLRKSAAIAEQCWQMSIREISIGMSEIEIAELITRNFERLGAANSFAPTVNAGDKTQPGHGSPTRARLEKGDLLHVDMGARYQGYCSDIQRLAYFKKDDQSSAPRQLQQAFCLVKKIIDVTSKEYQTGAIGCEIDALAREMLREKNYPEYQYCLGHQIGRQVHDGAALVGPTWKRYIKATTIALEKHNVFTVELGIPVAGIGYVGLEEDLVVTDRGGEFLGQRQLELIVK